MATFIQDRQTYKLTAREYTPEGFLRVPGRVAKAGTQQYLRRELGLDGDPNSVVTVYRPPEEVFRDESLSTYHLADITYLHPAKLVDADTFKSTSAGVVDGAGRRDGDFVVCDLVIKDANAIKQIESGVAELSAGYTAEYIQESGVTADGVPYDYVQRDIKINHVAIVPTARAGRQARIFDNDPKGKSMQKVTLDSGRTVEIEDAAVALLVTDSIERLNTQIKAQADKLQAAQATIDAQREKIEEFEKEDEDGDRKIKEKVEKVTKTRDAALVVAGSGFTCDSVDPVEIQRAALAVARPNVAWADKDAAYVAAAFDMAVEFSKDKPAGNPSHVKFAADAATQLPTNDGKPTQDAYSAYKAAMLQPTKARGGQ